MVWVHSYNYWAWFFHLSVQEAVNEATTGNLIVDLLSGESIWLILLALLLSSVLTWLLKDRVAMQKMHADEIAKRDGIIADKDKRIEELHDLARNELRESVQGFNTVSTALDKVMGLQNARRDAVTEKINDLTHTVNQILQETLKNNG
jgi:methyl-accepting chemotaxis protein